MARFSAKKTAEAVVLAPRQQIWDLLVDPDAIAEMTPFVKQITAEGEHWHWQMSGLDVLGVKVSPAFTERMVFSGTERIEFRHDPPADRTERSAVDGWYDLADADHDSREATRLTTSLEIHLELPLPKLSSPAVTGAMRGVISQMGDRFSQNLLDRLGTTQV